MYCVYTLYVFCVLYVGNPPLYVMGWGAQLGPGPNWAQGPNWALCPIGPQGPIGPRISGGRAGGLHNLGPVCLYVFHQFAVCISCVLFVYTLWNLGTDVGICM
jgi:hypothetical protein